jgi:prephenate dehydrogenase
MTESPRIIPVTPQGTSPEQTPIFKNVAIVGLGLIGGSIALAARRLWPASLIIGVDSNEVLERAVVLHAIDVGADHLSVVAGADLVILAAPVGANIALLRELADHLDRAAVVTDVSSTKRAVVEAARALPAHLSFLGGHPLAGAARAGIGFARPDLFSGRPWFFTPESPGGSPALERLSDFVSALGARPHILGAAEHDRLLAFISHLPQLGVTSLMHVVGEAVGAEGLALCGPGLAHTTRLASSPATVWTEICRTNADQIAAALDALIATLQQVRAGLDNTDFLVRLFSSANSWRDRVRIE